MLNGGVRMDISFTIDDQVLNIRSGAVIICNDSVLCSTHEGIPYLYLPGGRVQLMENSEAACVREVKEELGVDIKVERLLWSTESFFLEESTQKKFHELCFYYLVTLCEALEYMKQDEFIIQEQNIKYTCQWINLKSLDTANIKPAFLCTHLQDLPSSPMHLILHE